VELNPTEGASTHQRVHRRQCENCILETIPA
jgi:hypothetical protein